MAVQKPRIPKGTRDFLPYQVARREYIFRTIREVFRKYGYRGIETPAIEALSTLTGKYGEEGDQLLFKVLNNGDFLARADQNALAAKDSKRLTPTIAKRGLRYDLTVPFARYVVMHQNDLQLPFKRYAIQPVWRADRPQKGRYQEFYQCDVDVVGSDSLMYEAELIQIFDEVYSNLGLEVEIKINNRKILAGIAEHFGLEDQFSTLAVIIDKLDKIGNEKVLEQIRQLGLNSEQANSLLEMLSLKDIDKAATILENSSLAQKGIQELKRVLLYLEKTPTNNEIIIDLTLARGLSYYTGCIIEVKSKQVQMGSIGGGGRYDDLTGNFGLSGVSGVGISIGAERVYDVMEELELFKQLELGKTDIIILAMDEASHEYGFQLASEIRKSGISCDIYPEPAKFKKQIKYAGNGNYKYALIIGEQERQSGKLTLKHLESGQQDSLQLEDIISKIRI